MLKARSSLVRFIHKHTHRCWRFTPTRAPEQKPPAGLPIGREKGSAAFPAGISSDCIPIRNAGGGGEAHSSGVASLGQPVLRALQANRKRQCQVGVCRFFPRISTFFSLVVPLGLARKEARALLTLALQFASKKNGAERGSRGRTNSHRSALGGKKHVTLFAFLFGRGVRREFPVRGADVQGQARP